MLIYIFKRTHENKNIDDENKTTLQEWKRWNINKLRKLCHVMLWNCRLHFEPFLGLSPLINKITIFKKKKKDNDDETQMKPAQKKRKKLTITMIKLEWNQTQKKKNKV